MRKFRMVTCSALMGVGACTITHKIEPSDKPIVVDLNIKHEMKLKIEEDNQDLLNLESEVLKKETKKKKAG